MTYRPACEAAKAAAEARSQYNLIAHPDWRLVDNQEPLPAPDHSVKCGACGERHETVLAVQSCYADMYYMKAEMEAERYAEDAWLRHAENRDDDYDIYGEYSV
jgi:hypothetical protein